MLIEIHYKRPGNGAFVHSILNKEPCITFLFYKIIVEPHAQIPLFESGCDVVSTYAVKNCGMFVLQNGIAPNSRNNCEKKMGTVTIMTL